MEPLSEPSSSKNFKKNDVFTAPDPWQPSKNDNMTTPLTVFYDGLCPLCSREIAHYRRKAAAGAVEFVDNTAPTFDAAGRGLDAGRVRRLMHVKAGDEVRVGLEAFIALWDAIPAYRGLARLARLPGLHGLLALGYRAFAVVRPWLPRRRRPDCAAGTCER